jgi:uncharacterized membrane protein (UPF0127 family)
VSRRRARSSLLAAAAALLSACSTAGVGCKTGGGRVVPDARETGAVVAIEAGDRKITFRVELARTEAERERGLMYRERLAPDAGMLFVFEHPSLLTFWMKNTLIPLDMIFIGADRRISGVVADAEPQTLTARRVEALSQYVLEIGGGLAARLGLGAGQHVELPLGEPAP